MGGWVEEEQDLIDGVFCLEIAYEPDDCEHVEILSSRSISFSFRTLIFIVLSPRGWGMEWSTVHCVSVYCLTISHTY